MDIRMSQEKLLKIIRSSSEECIELKQVYNRLHDLVSLKLDSLISDLTSLFPDDGRSVLIRRAYLHPDYIGLLEQYLSSKNNYTHSRVMYDTHMMLFEARRSMNSYNRELINKKSGF